MSSRIVLFAALASALAFAADPKPPDFIKPYPGQNPYGEPQQRDFDEVYVLSGKVKAEPPSAGWQKLEGKMMQWHYDMPEGRSSLEVFKNYEQALKAAGFETVFSCSESSCGEYSGPVQTWLGAGNSFVNSKSRYALTKLKRAEGTVWAVVYITQVGLPLTKVIVVEEKAMETGMVKVDAAALKKGLDSDGFIAVYGIEFDTGKATLKPSSTAAFEEVKKLLDASPELKLYVVGHTDDVGQESANVALSNSRAAAVVQELTTKYKVAKNRLKSAGVGPYSPVASNENEAGRAKNRRVVLVKDVP